MQFILLAQFQYPLPSLQCNIVVGSVSRKRAEGSFFRLLDDKEAEFWEYLVRNAYGYSLITFCACRSYFHHHGLIL